MKRVLLDVEEGLTRVALVEEGRLVELYYDTKREESLVGNIYVGRVAQVVPNLQACFVEIGHEKKGYLYYGSKRAESDTGERAHRPKVGEDVIVQVEKDAVGTKGAVLTRSLSFPGKFLVLLEEAGEIRVSRKITDNTERARIREVVRTLLPPENGIIIRTNGAGRSPEEYEKEIQLLLEKAAQIKGGAYRKSPALLLCQSVPVERAVRDFYGESIDEIVINDETAYSQLLRTEDFDGENQPKLALYQDKLPLFEAFFVEGQSRKALEERVWLKSGGFLVIQETEACVVIDVNSGKSAGRGDMERAIKKTNLEAAEEVARQLRLRNLSGIIIVDFIDLVSAEERNVLTKALEVAVSHDRIKTVVVGMTELGLMQLTRKKTRPSLSRQMTTKCRQCEGSGRLPSVEYTVVCMRREVEGILANTIYNQVRVRGDARLLAAFAGAGGSYLEGLRERCSGEVICESKNDMYFGQYEIMKGKK